METPVRVLEEMTGEWKARVFWRKIAVAA